MSDIFVFGANLWGRHGAGAAKAALEQHGAIEGQGWGRQGNSYAIPTKSTPWDTLPLSDIERWVNIFITYALDHPSKTFQVTAIGTGLAGYSAAQIAPFFAHAPANCHLPEEFKKVLGK